MASSNTQCEKCNAPAQLHITSEQTGVVGMRHLCLDCAELEGAVKQRRKRAFNLGAVFIALGSLMFMLSVFADHLRIGDSNVFGAWQMTGVLVAIILTGVGAALRIPTILVLGPSVGLIALLADQVGLGDTPGFGRRQMIGCVLGAGMIALGVMIVFLRKKWAMRVRIAPSLAEPRQESQCPEL
jgi:hypothetical protein